MMDVGWKQSAGAFARGAALNALVLATLWRMGPKRKYIPRGNRDIDRVNVIGLL